jgi:hypothetical protein
MVEWFLGCAIKATGIGELKEAQSANCSYHEPKARPGSSQDPRSESHVRPVAESELWGGR